MIKANGNVKSVIFAEQSRKGNRDMSIENIDLFADAFRTNHGSIRMTCNCGKEFFELDSTQDWDEGEYDKLLADDNCIGLPYGPYSLCYGGQEFVAECDCWQSGALKIMGFLDSHNSGIAKYLRLIKTRKQFKANNLPIVEQEGEERLKDTKNPVLKKHPEVCPNCKSKDVTYERFSLKYSEYLCDNCGWGMDAFTGIITYEGMGDDVKDG